MNGLRDLGDDLKNKLGEGVVVLASAKDGKVSLDGNGNRWCHESRRSCREI